MDSSGKPSIFKRTTKDTIIYQNLTFGIARNRKDYNSGNVGHIFLTNTIDSASDYIDYEDKKYASKNQILFNYFKNNTSQFIHELEFLHITQDYGFGSHFPNPNIIPKFIPGVPGSDGTDPLDIPLEGHPIYLKVWTGIPK